MENQKVVDLLTLEVRDHRIIKVAKLDFTKWKESGVIEVIGDMGNGKSTLLESIATATTGTNHIKDKSLLEKGFKSEVCLSDGEHKVYMGVKVSEYSRGSKKGEPKFETYIYEYDSNGKVVNNPVIDGVSASAKEYSEMLSTALTFKMADMFSENQSTHRKLIESLFAEELSDLGVDEILENIAIKKEGRDSARYECERNSAFMEHFKSEGFSKEGLEQLATVKTDGIESEIESLKVKKGILLKDPEEAKEKRLNKIKEEGRNVVEEIRSLNEKRQKEYRDWKVLRDAYDEDTDHLQKLTDCVEEITAPTEIGNKLVDLVEEWSQFITNKHKAVLEAEEMKEPVILEISDGQVNIYEDTVIPAEYKELMSKRSEIGKRYKAEKERPIDLSEIDTSEIDAKIKEKETEKEEAEKNNSLVSRFNLWNKWIEAKGLYEKEVDNLRKLYTKIDTGVNGLFIQPSLLDSGRLEIWMEYTGEHDPELFGNKNKELRRLYEYSKSQRAIVGVLLQAARLDKKDKALRLVVLDDYTQTSKGKALLEKICQEKSLKLIISKTDDRYKIEDLDESQILIENGELLLGGGDEK